MWSRPGGCLRRSGGEATRTGGAGRLPRVAPRSHPRIGLSSAEFLSDKLTFRQPPTPRLLPKRPQAGRKQGPSDAGRGRGADLPLRETEIHTEKSSGGGGSAKSDGVSSMMSPCGGARAAARRGGCGASRICRRIFSMALASMTAARIRMRPWQRGHSSASTRKTRCRSAAHGRRPGGGCSRGPRDVADCGATKVGTTLDRYPAAGARIPWNLMGCLRDRPD